MFCYLTRRLQRSTHSDSKKGMYLRSYRCWENDRYCGFNPRYLRGASAYIIVVDQTRSQSLLEGIEILEMAREHYPDIPAFFVVNKTDLPSSWHWSEEELDSYAKKFTSLTKTSAKTGENVENLFTTIAFW